jgi:hypothetical protein
MTRRVYYADVPMLPGVPNVQTCSRSSIGSRLKLVTTGVQIKIDFLSDKKESLGCAESGGGAGRRTALEAS